MQRILHGDLYLLHEVDRDDGVRSGAALVHECGSNGAIIRSFLDLLLDLLVGIDAVFL
jgi:hypothetical protein